MINETFIGKAFRFKVKQTYDYPPYDSDWSDYKILATNMEPDFLQNEYVEFYARGTGARNHNTSYFKIDNYTLLDSGVLRGLYLIVLSRKDLSKVYSDVYDLMKKENSYPLNVITTETIKSCVNYTNNETLTGAKFWTYNGTNITALPPMSNVVSNGGALTELVNITVFLNATEICNITINKYNTRNFT